MENTATYTAWITIKIEHTFFVNGGNGVTIIPTRDTHKLLTRTGVIIKQSGSSTWLLLKEEGRSEIVEEDLIGKLEFCMMNNDPGFYYYTDNVIKDSKPVWEVIPVAKNGIWKTLAVTIDKQLLNQKIIIDITVGSAEKFLEFLVIAKSGNRSQLALKESNGKLVFKQSEIDFPGESLPVYRFVTDKPIQLKEVYNYSIQLWELKENGESLLSNNVPFPKAASASAISPQNTISSYFYF